MKETTFADIGVGSRFTYAEIDGIARVYVKITPYKEWGLGTVNAWSIAGVEHIFDDDDPVIPL